MVKIHYQCSNCGQRFQTSAMAGIPHGMYSLGCRAVGDAFYCEDCVKTWAERNGDEFDRQYKNPFSMFAKWWNCEVEQQVKDKNKIKTYRLNSVGNFEEMEG